MKATNFKEIFEIGRRIQSEQLTNSIHRPPNVSPLLNAQWRAVNNFLSLAKDAAQPVSRLLDVGSGPRVFCSLVEHHGLMYYAMDAYSSPGSEATRNFFVRARAESIPFKNESFDFIMCLEVLEHIFDIRGALDDMERVLRSGGHALLTIPFAQPLHEEPHDYWRLTEHALRILIHDAGFEIVSLSTRGSPFELLFHYISAVILGIESRLFPKSRILAAIRAVGIPLLSSPRNTTNKMRRFPHGYILIVRKASPGDCDVNRKN